MRLFGIAVAIAIVAGACGGSANSDDAGADVVYGHKNLDAIAGYEAEAAAKVPWARMEPHLDIVLGSPHIRVIYIGAQGVDQSPSFDAYLEWLVTSTDYWSILSQYGVGYATIDGDTQIDTDAFFTPGMIVSGFVDAGALDTRCEQVIHAPPPSDAGAADDGDTSEGGASTLPQIPYADAYIFFLPNGVNVDLGSEGKTCSSVLGYHSYDGKEPFAIIPACGRLKVTIAHEMAEMVTDPVPGAGWFSDADQSNAGGEVGDLCNYPTMSPSGYQVTGLWSNDDGDCEPP